MSRVLVTAFEPFDGTGLNSSLAALRAFAGESRDAAEVATAVLPVAYGADSAALRRAWDETQPEVILHLGQSRQGWIGVERLGINVRTVPVDLAAARDPACRQQQIEPDGPPAYFATVPVDSLAGAVRARGIPCRVSNHAGIYHCNHVLYTSLHRAATQARVPRIGFLHLPRLPEQVQDTEDGEAPCLTLEQLVAAVEAAVGAAAAGG